MKSFGLALLLFVSSGVAHFKGGGGGCRNYIKYIPHYITQYKTVPQYETIYKEVSVPTPVPKIVYETKYVDHYVTKTAFKPVYKTVYQPQLVTQVKEDVIYKTQFATKFVPQYVTQTEFLPKFVTETAQHTQTVKVAHPVTVCPNQGGGGGGGYAAETHAVALAQGSGYSDYK